MNIIAGQARKMQIRYADNYIDTHVHGTSAAAAAISTVSYRYMRPPHTVTQRNK